VTNHPRSDGDATTGVVGVVTPYRRTASPPTSLRLERSDTDDRHRHAYIDPVVIEGYRRHVGKRPMNELHEAVEKQLDKGRPDDGRETIGNKRRGCGHLKPTSAYVRTDVSALSGPGGEIPRFVELDDPVEYREHTGKGAIIPGFNAFPGNSFSLHYAADGRTTTPSGDIHDHIERLSRYGFDAEHYGKITSARSIDILMSVGKTNWETPEDFIDECIDRGLNLKIPTSDRQEPPVVEPLRTRCWVIHPHGAGEGRPGIIGYSYLTRTVFTTGTKATADDPDIPAWAEDYAAAGKMEVVDRGEPIPADDDAPSTTLEDFEVDDADDVEAVDESEPDDEDDRDVATITVADGEAPGDVSGVEIEFGREDIHRDRRRVSFEDAVDGPLPYNALKVVAANRDEIEVGSTPSTDDLIDAIVDDADGFVPAYDRGELVEFTETDGGDE